GRLGHFRICRCRPRLLRQARERLREWPAGRHCEGGAKLNALPLDGGGLGGGGGRRKARSMKYRPAIGSTKRARELRTNMTDAERAMWRLLREGFPDARFRRQVPIRSFIADFASHRVRLVIEIDGGQHSEEQDSGRTRLIDAE